MKRTAMYVGVVLAPLLFATGGGTTARAASSHVDVRCGGFGKVVLKYPNLYGIGKFHCPSGAKSATETIVLQGYEHGKWTNLESKSLTVRAVPNKTYVVRTTPIHCSSSPHHENVRTRWWLVAGQLRLRTPPSGRFPTYCIGP